MVHFGVRTLTGSFVRQQLEAFSAVALEAADGVPAEVVASAVVQLTLVDVCGEQRTARRHSTTASRGGGGVRVNLHSDLCMFFRPAAA